ncbi:MAG: CHAT domain-containing protein [Roseiflexaceae bacterium]
MALCCLRRGDLWQALVYTERAKARYLADLFEQHARPHEDVWAAWRAKGHNLAALLGRSGAPRDDTRAIIEQAIAGLPPRSAIVVFNITEEDATIFIVMNQHDKQIKATLDPNWQTSPDGRLHVCRLKTLNRIALQNLLVRIEQDGSVSGYLGDYHAEDRDSDPATWERRFRSTLRRTCEELSTALLWVVDQVLMSLGVERLILMPNLGLSLLPLHACPIGCTAGPAYLLDRYEISYAPSFDLLRHAQAQVQEPARAGHEILAVANPKKKKLYWADVEVATIVKLFTCHITMHQATPEEVLELAPAYTYLHFGCHGHFNLAEPLLSALELVPRDLTLAMMLPTDPEIRLKLSRARLVVLGACEIGMVDFADLADEAMSLPSGFMLAGAPAVIGTLWRVNDLATSMLMEQFYHYHLKGDTAEGPLAPAAALQRAQIWLRDEVTLEYLLERLEQHKRSLPSSKKIERMNIDSLQARFSSEHHHNHQARPFDHPWYWAAFTVTGA